MNATDMLSRRLNLPDIKRLAEWVLESSERRLSLWGFVSSEDRRVSINALWVMTHLPSSESGWLVSLRNEMIDLLLVEKDTGKKRLLLHLLREQNYAIDDLRTDLLDFCMSKINSECEPYAVRCFAIYIAFKMCRHYSELLDELEGHLDMMSFQTLSPGLKSALRQTKRKISKERN